MIWRRWKRYVPFAVAIMLAKTALGDIIFTKVADFDTAIPGGEGAFTVLRSGVAVDGGRVVFEGHGSNSQQGVYVYENGNLGVIADRNTIVPGMSETFSGFRDPVSFRNGTAAFIGAPTGMSAREQVYANDAQGLRQVTNSFGTLNSPSADGDVIAWSYRFQNKGHIQTRVGAGPIETVAEQGAPTPDGAAYGDFYWCAGDGLNIAYSASTSEVTNAQYARIGGVYQLVAKNGMPMPGSETNLFTQVDVRQSIDGETVVFSGISQVIGVTRQAGIYKYEAGSLTRVMDRNTPLPGGGGNFDEGGQQTLDAGDIVFRGLSAGNRRGIYGIFDDSLFKIIDNQDFLGGKAIDDFALQPDEALSGDRVVFWVLFQDGTQGVYLATVPEPAMWMLALAAAAILRGRLR